MNNPLMNGGGNAPAPIQNQMTPQQALSQLKNDPISLLNEKGYRVPNELANNPMGMINYLMQSGQIPQNRLTNLLQRMQGGKR